MKSLEKRIEKLEEKAEVQSEILVIRVLFVGHDGEVKNEVILGPGGTQEWKNPESHRK